jgi:CheY-like chemotaxis protein
MTSDLRILVVDDDATSRAIIELMLTRLGYSADVASDGITAVVAVQMSAYDTVLMDVRMPLMDGMETTRRIRSLTGPKSRPSVVALTGDSSDECQRLCREAGMDEFLSKPLDFDQLGEAMERERRRLQVESQKRPVAVPDGTSFDPPEVPPAEVTLAFDRGALDSLTADLGAEGVSIRNDLIETYLSDSQDRITSITSAARDGDLAAVAFQAHALKSASATLGLYALARESDSIERRIGESVEAVSLAQLGEEYRRSVQLLGAVLEEDQPAG